MCKKLSSDCTVNMYISRGYGERNWTTKTSFFIIKIMYFVYVAIEACLHIGLGVPINFANTSIAIHPNFKMIYWHAFEHGIENKEVLIEDQICNILLMRFESNLFAQISQFCDSTFSWDIFHLKMIKINYLAILNSSLIFKILIPIALFSSVWI